MPEFTRSVLAVSALMLATVSSPESIAQETHERIIKKAFFPDK